MDHIVNNAQNKVTINIGVMGKAADDGFETVEFDGTKSLLQPFVEQHVKQFISGSVSIHLDIPSSQEAPGILHLR